VSTAISPAADLVDDWGGRLFHSPRGLYPFQLDDVAACYLNIVDGKSDTAMVLWDQGTGKTIFAMALAALMFEDDQIDHVLVVAEANKIADWADEDFPRFTRLSSLRYKGAPARRQRILDSPPQVLASTYETARNDIATFAKKAHKPSSEGRLMDFLRGKRVLVVYDEFSRLGSRTSALYKAHEYMLRTLRADPGSTVYAVGLTATSVERGAETHFNVGRLLAPDMSPGIGQFAERYIRAYDNFGNPSQYRNLTPLDCEPGITPLSRVYAPITFRRRKSDPAIMAQFPAKVENPFRFVPLSAAHMDFYNEVSSLVAEMPEDEQAGQFGVLRQIAGHPASLIHSQGSLAKAIVETVGPNALRAMGSAKVEEMVDWARLNQEQQMVIFTFFGQSILPLLHDRLRGEGYNVDINHGQMSSDQRQAAQDSFKAGTKQIFLTSDAGARGLNLGCGSALLHYELPSKYSIYAQRSDRIHRIDSVHPSITVDALVAGGQHDQETVENHLAGLMTKRNTQSDQVNGDDLDEHTGDILTAVDRVRMLATARRFS
jgi:hypothetical protein